MTASTADRTPGTVKLAVDRPVEVETGLITPDPPVISPEADPASLKSAKMGLSVAEADNGRSALQILQMLTEQPETSAYDLVKGYWAQQDKGGDFEAWWRRAVHDGVVPGSALPTRTPADRSEAMRRELAVGNCRGNRPGSAKNARNDRGLRQMLPQRHARPRICGAGEPEGL